MSSAVQYVYDLSSQTEGDGNHIFMSKQWTAILDNNASVYSSNMSTIETSSLSNSSKWANWYEAKLIIPISIYLSQNSNTATTFAPATNFCDFALGFKNSFLTIINSISIMYNGVSINTLAPLSSMYNCFKLMTSMNASDFSSFASLGFSPDTLSSVLYTATPTLNGVGTCNNSNYGAPQTVSGTQANKAELSQLQP